MKQHLVEAKKNLAAKTEVSQRVESPTHLEIKTQKKTSTAKMLIKTVAKFTVENKNREVHGRNNL